MRIGITGANGLLGWHLRCHLKARATESWIETDRETFSSAEKLLEFVSGCDAVIHLAGMNRGDENEVAETNVLLTQKLVRALEGVSKPIPVIFSSSTHIYRETPYGRSKRACAELLEAWAGKSGAKFTNVVLGHVFGELGKPFYNSAVSTFCHQLARRESPGVDKDAELSLIHASDAVGVFLSSLESGSSGTIEPDGFGIPVSKLLQKLQHMDQLYRNQVIPELSQDIDLKLFNTLRSYYFPRLYPVRPKLHEDSRGRLFECLKSQQGGQAFMSSTAQGVTRGNHFHIDKVERFCVVSGEATIRLRRLFSTETIEFPVSGLEPSFVDIPTLHTHHITNTGHNELLTLFWAHELFDPNRPDTFAEPV